MKYIPLYNIILVSSIIGLWLSTKMPQDWLNSFGMILILTVGIGHGANDLKIFFTDKRVSLKNKISFILIYSAVVAIGFLSFFLIPQAALALFLLISGYHFGQEHFEKYRWKSNFITKLGATAYGAFILSMLFSLHPEGSLEVINEFLNMELNRGILNYTLVGSAVLLASSTFLLRHHWSWKNVILEIFYLFVLFIIFSTGSLIWSFAIYFVLWHSVPSIYHQIEFLYGKVNKRNAVKYLKFSYLFWIAALLFLAVLYYFLHDSTELFLTILVAFLGGITLPHVFVMDRIGKD